MVGDRLIYPLTSNGGGGGKGGYIISANTYGETIDIQGGAIYSITKNITNGSASGASTILPNGTATITITADSGYYLPNVTDIIVTNATKGTFEDGILTISNPTGSVTISATCVAPARCVVDGLGSIDPSNVTFTKQNNFTKAGLGIEDITFNGDTFVKIPIMYRKVNAVANNQIISYTISTKKEDDSFVPYTVFIDENGNAMDYVLVGKYLNKQTNTIDSKPGTTQNPTTMHIGDARAKAKARGTGYQLFDWQFQKLWQDLYTCLKETINTWPGGSTVFTTDNVGLYWNRADNWVDGVSAYNDAWIFSYKPSLYVDEPTSNTTGYISSGYSIPVASTSDHTITTIKALGYDSNNPFFNFPSEITNYSQLTNYYCDNIDFYPDNLNKPVYLTVEEYRDARYGAFYCDISSGWDEPSRQCPIRLCYRPIQ